MASRELTGLGRNLLPGPVGLVPLGSGLPAQVVYEPLQSPSTTRYALGVARLAHQALELLEVLSAVPPHARAAVREFVPGPRYNSGCF
jgi:hypothetical protein